MDPVIDAALRTALSLLFVAAAAHKLRDMGQFRTTLAEYHLLHAAQADLLRRLGRRAEAADAYRRAAALTANQAEQAFLGRRLAEVTAG